MIKIASSSFMQMYDPANPPPEAATAAKAQILLDQFNADQAEGKFDEADPTFNGYENYLRNVIRDGGMHPPFPPYPKYKAQA